MSVLDPLAYPLAAPDSLVVCLLGSQEYALNDWLSAALYPSIPRLAVLVFKIHYTVSSTADVRIAAPSTAVDSQLVWCTSDDFTAALACPVVSGPFVCTLTVRL